MGEPLRHMAIKSAVGYVRCSTEMQEDSPEQQKREILAFAEQHGYVINDWFEDFGKSGTTFSGRPEFLRLSRQVDHKPKFSAVICYDESRWGRAIDAEENTYWRVYFRQRGVDVVLVKTSVDQKNEFAPMLAAFEGVQASQYSKKLSELTLRGAKANGIYSNGGTAPYGYIRIAVNTKTGTERELKPGEWCVSGQEKVKWGLGDPAEIKTVELIYKRRVFGIGYGSIAQELNSKNIPCAKRGRWRNKDQKWSEVTVKAIIENHSYYGARIYNRNSMSKIQARQKGLSLDYNASYPHWRNDPSEWIIVEDAHDPIVTKELWTKANAFRQEKDPTGNHVRHRSPYLLTGLIRCSRCGFTFQGWSGKAGNKTYLKYADSGHFNKRVCTHFSIKKEPIEGFVVKAIKETLSDSVFLENIEKHLKRLLESRPQGEKIEVERITKAMRENEEKIKNLTEAIEQGGGSEALLARLRKLEMEQRALQAQLDRTEPEPITAIDLKHVRELVERFVHNFKEEFCRVPLDVQKALVKKMISEIIVDREKNVVRVYVRRVPSVTPAVEELLKKEKELTNIVSSSCSGGRT